MRRINSRKLTGIAFDHAVHPRNMGALPEFNGHARVTGSDGCTMLVWVLVRGDKVGRVSFITDGSDGCVAAASMICSITEGRKLREVMALEAADILNSLEGMPEEYTNCAALACHALKAALMSFYRRWVDIFIWGDNERPSENPKGGRTIAPPMI